MTAVQKQRIFLVGLMGSGKSYYSKQIAAALNYPAFDLDTYIEQEYNTSIRSIFLEKGEAYFREIEQKALLSFAKYESFVMATGGGTPCFFNAMDWMNANGTTVWLDFPIELIAERVTAEKEKRPLLHGIQDDATLIRFLTQKRAERIPVYSSAHHIIQNETELNELVPNFSTVKD